MADTDTKQTKPKLHALAADEREIGIFQTDDERAEGIWHVYTSSPYWIRHLDKIAEGRRADGFGGQEYTLKQNQVLLRQSRKPKQLSERQRNILAERMRSLNSK